VDRKSLIATKIQPSAKYSSSKTSKTVMLLRYCNIICQIPESFLYMNLTPQIEWQLKSTVTTNSQIIIKNIQTGKNSTVHIHQ